MRLRLLALTSSLNDVPPGYEISEYWNAGPDELAEVAGRLCYKSYDRPNPKTRTNLGYLSNILDHRHFSVLEHASATFWVGEASRTFTHELVRHRHLSFSQVSQRYVNEYKTGIVIPEGIRDDDILVKELQDLDKHAKEVYLRIQSRLEAKGLEQKRRNQAARAALLGSQQTEIIVSGNMRAWREVIEKRNSEHADPEIRTFAKMLLEVLKEEVAPNTFQDMEV